MRNLEERLRDELARAADEAPGFRGHWSSPVRSRKRALVAGGVLAACVAGLVGAAAIALRPQQEPPEASCAAVLDFEGRRYSPVGDVFRMPQPAGKVGAGFRPGCDDGNGASSDSTVDVLRIHGVDPETAMVAGDDLWLADDADAVPPLLQKALRRPRCTFSAPATVTGSWISVLTPRRPRFDGDIRPPGSIELRTSDPDVVGRQWEYADIRVRLTGTTRLPEVGEIKDMLYEGETAQVAVRCVEGRFVAASLAPAGS